ncbi:hypothetical protein ACWD3I_00605 [Streptomyces sp. NPDC002817]|uniref:hypothetical protein n=1 Tax=Streptomyces sp. NPDC088357 TaxID=3154655 RepID=UPI00343BBE65
MKTTRRIRALAAGLLVASLAACTPGNSGESVGADGKPYIEADYATYTSASDVSSASDVGILGAVLSLSFRECDEGGDPAGEVTVSPTAADEGDPSPDASATDEPVPSVTPTEVAGGSGTEDCLPMVFMKVRVAGIMKNTGFNINVDDQIIVGNIDLDAVTMEGATELVVGKTYVLYLDNIGEGDAPGVSGVGSFWIPVGGNQGIFLQGKGTVTPASANIVALTSAEAQKITAGGATPAKKFTTTVEALRKVSKLSASKASSAAKAAKSKKK